MKEGDREEGWREVNRGGGGGGGGNKERKQHDSRGSGVADAPLT